MLVAPAFAVQYGTADVQQYEIPGTTMNLYFNPYFSGGVNAWASFYEANITNVVMNPGVQWTVKSGQVFCIEAQYSGPNAPYKIVDLADAPVINGPGGGPMGAVKAGWISKLFGTYYSPLVQTNAQYAAAMQTSIWEIVYDTPQAWNVAAGDFYATGDAFVLSTAQAWLSSLNAQSLDYGPGLVALSNDSYQDYIRPKVPEIPAAMLCPLGLAVLGMIRRRFAK